MSHYDSDDQPEDVLHRLEGAIESQSDSIRAQREQQVEWLSKIALALERIAASPALERIAASLERLRP